MTKKKLSAIIAMSMVVCLAVAGISAYFTDGDTVTNTFTVGKISIDLQEPEWVPPTDIVPEQEFPKDPEVVNDGVNDAYIFMEVIVPYANVVTANDDGSKNAAADTELFKYDVKSGWVEIGSGTKNASAKTVTHLYAYAPALNQAMTAVSAGDSTGSIFDYIQFANIVEDQSIETTTLEVVINAYAIQTTNINDGNTALDGDNADGKTLPAAVWAVLSAQAPSTAVSATESVNTDIKA